MFNRISENTRSARKIAKPMAAGQTSSHSMMPAGPASPLSRQELRRLIIDMVD